MKLFVTGATGFIGSYFVNEAIKSGYEVAALKFDDAAPVIPLKENIKWIRGDLEKGDYIIPSNTDVVVHAAAYGVSPQPAEWEKSVAINVLGTLKLLNKAKNTGVNKMILIGSSLEYGESGARYEFIPIDAPLEPIGAYATSKAASTLICSSFANEHGVHLKVLRIFNAYGDGQYEKNLFPALKKAASKGEDFELTKGEQIRDFICVDHAAKKIVTELKIFNTNVIAINIGTGRPQTVRQFAEYWWRKWNASGKLKIGALPYRENEVMRFVPKI